jgi:hypothetical protein
MKKLLLLAAVGAALSVTACASDGGYVGAGYGYDYVGPADVWYDGYYGPYVDGYWGDGGAFFYRDGDGHYRRDAGGHFRSHAFDGGQHFNAGHRPR